jgi:hypothetical protein
MSDIYQAASQVLTWLGNNEVLECFLRHSKWDGYDEDQTPDGQLVLHCLSDTYWNRSWVVQEVLLARNIRIFIGTHGASNPVRF